MYIITVNYKNKIISYYIPITSYPDPTAPFCFTFKNERPAGGSMSLIVDGFKAGRRNSSG